MTTQTPDLTIARRHRNGLQDLRVQVAVLQQLVAQAGGRVPGKTDQPRNRNTAYSRQMRFDMICEANGIEHRQTKPNHPWSSEDQKTVRGTAFPRGGQVERMNRTIKEATVKRFHYGNHEQLRTHLGDFTAAYNFARRLKTLSGLMPYEYICKILTSEPGRFILNPIH
ncbi:transposase [Leisingera methylohalidivorans DSM 14336]|uniref:Transposase n=1 Tax=Leisingera methylohalidivorans DSM 14336 TaxID=999552 RepID=V9VUU8_9RHOB|nr:transposase [Leisingera methylohalidivorans DSM 14336]